MFAKECCNKFRIKPFAHGGFEGSQELLQTLQKQPLFNKIRTKASIIELHHDRKIVLEQESELSLAARLEEVVYLAGVEGASRIDDLHHIKSNDANPIYPDCRHKDQPVLSRFFCLHVRNIFFSYEI